MDVNKVFDIVKKKINFPFHTLKLEQQRGIRQLLDAKNVCCLLPTGYGKSVMFYLPPLLLNEIHGVDTYKTIVVSPLRSLMAQQSDSLSKMGVGSAILGSKREMSADDYKGIISIHHM